MLRDGRWCRPSRTPGIFSRGSRTSIRIRVAIPRRTPTRWRPRLSRQRAAGDRGGQATLLDGAHAIGHRSWSSCRPDIRRATSSSSSPIAENARCSCGDVMHPSLAVYAPHWNSRFCELPTRHAATRRGCWRLCPTQGAALPVHSAPRTSALRERRSSVFAALRRRSRILSPGQSRRRASAFDADDPRGRAVMPFEAKRQCDSLKRSAMRSSSEHLDHRIPLEPPLVVAPRSGRREGHAPERLFREANPWQPPRRRAR